MTDAFELAETVLDIVRTGLGVDGRPVPDRRYVTVGAGVHDCEQLTVSITGDVFPAGHGPQGLLAVPTYTVEMRGVALVVCLLRCVPTVTERLGKPVYPTPEAETEAARGIMSDRASIVRSIRALVGRQLPGCGGTAGGVWSAIGAEGGIAGGQIPLQLLVE